MIKIALLFLILQFLSCSPYEESNHRLMYSSQEEKAFSFLNEIKTDSFPGSLFDEDKKTKCKSTVLRSDNLKKTGDLETKVVKSFKNTQFLHLQFNDQKNKGLYVTSNCEKTRHVVGIINKGNFEELISFEKRKKHPLAYFSLDGKYTVIVKTGKESLFDFFLTSEINKLKPICSIKINREIKLRESMQWDINSTAFFVAQFPREKNRRVFVLNPQTCEKYRIDDPRNVMRRASNYSDVDSKNNRIRLVTFNDPPIIHQFLNDDYRYYKMEPIPAPPKSPE